MDLGHLATLYNCSARNKDICVIKRVREGLYKDCILRLEPQLLLSSLDCIPISVYIYHLSNKEYTSAHSFRNIHFFSRSDWTWASTIWTAPKIMMSHACSYGIGICLSVQTSESDIVAQCFSPRVKIPEEFIKQDDSTIIVTQRTTEFGTPTAAWFFVCVGKGWGGDIFSLSYLDLWWISCPMEPAALACAEHSVRYCRARWRLEPTVRKQLWQLSWLSI